MGRLGQAIAAPISAAIAGLAAARGLLFPWVPVFIAFGIAIWFALPFEPGPAVYTVLLLGGLGLGLFAWRGPELLQPMSVALLCVTLGALAAGLRLQSVAAPVLGFRYYGPVEGRILIIDRSQSDQIRLTLDQVILANVSPNKRPDRVRVTLHGDQRFLRPEPGQTIVVTVHLSAPDGPVEPDGFDFRRMAYFDRLGAVGYARSPALLLMPAKPGEQRINRLRAKIKAGVEEQISGPPGAFSAALLTGDRAGIPPSVLEDLRRSNLAHLLAISGLHMGLLVAIVFASLRTGLALVPALALRLNGKKLAAIAAFLAGWAYLLLSGGNVATERAFVMVAVMLGAVLLDRRALSLRSVAMAAVVVLLMQPETLLEPGFQMSFAATVALIAGFAALRGRGQRLPWAMAAVFTLVFSSFLAGLATAPVAAAHFNRIAGYGLLANLMAVPIMGALVMPAAVLAGVLAPFGLAAPALWLMQQGTTWVLWVAHWVAGFEGAVHGLPSPPDLVLPTLALGALWLVLWRGRLRFAGLVPIAASLVIWAMGQRPPVLISADGGLVGVISAQGRVLSAEKGAGFAARQWLENDGDLTDQASAAARVGISGPKLQRQFNLAGWRVVQLKGKTAIADLAMACASADMVILAARLEPGLAPPDCLIIDQTHLARSGPIALWPQSSGALWAEPTHKAQRAWARNPAALVQSFRKSPKAAGSAQAP